MTQKTRWCEICRQPIDAGRIEAIPETRLCAEHAEAIKKFGGEFITTAKQSDIGKTGSLKHNPGDVSFHEKTRNRMAMDKLRREYEGYPAEEC